MDMDGKVALVTGSTSGIGRATAVALAGRGAHVLVNGRNEERGEQVVATIRGTGGQADFLHATLSGVDSARALAKQAVAVGGGHVDILINNAGFAVGGPTQTATEAEFDETYAINVKVPFFLVADLAPLMAERGSGAIVNITTMVAGFGQPGLAVYGSSRAALELLTKSWAAEFGPSGVRVNAVSPGPVRTPMSEAMGDMASQMAALAPAGRVAAPEELAAAIAYLASDDASFVQGVILPVDGGRAAT
jgi:NAD(P)-dependent dehydrogenase (short-subunit alcohol dehydrogenase family)